MIIGMCERKVRKQDIGKVFKTIPVIDARSLSLGFKTVDLTLTITACSSSSTLVILLVVHSSSLINGLSHFPGFMAHGPLLVSDLPRGSPEAYYQSTYLLPTLGILEYIPLPYPYTSKVEWLIVACALILS